MKARTPSAILSVAILILAGLHVSSPQAQGGQRLALVVGNGDYGGTYSYPTAPKDARLVAGALETVGFEVTLLLNADKLQLTESAREFTLALDQAGPGAAGLFYYAGLGQTYEDENWIIPVGTRIRRNDAYLLEHGVSANNLLEQMERAGNDTNILILDASVGFSWMEIAASGSFIAYSAETGRYVRAGEDGYSVFAKAFADEIVNSDKTIRILMRDVSLRVQRETDTERYNWNEQIPWTDSSLSGGFWFNPATAVAETYPPAPLFDERPEDPAPQVSSDDSDAIAVGDYHALLIGVQDYLHESLTDLDEPLNDARRFRSVLLDSYTFDADNITLLENPRRGDVLDAFDAVDLRVTPDDSLIIFYAGHGYWDEDIEQGYWLPSDASRDSKRNWIANSTIQDMIRGIKSKHTLLVSDACFSGGLFRTRSAFLDAPQAARQLHSLPSRKAMTSGTLKEVPDVSVFVHYLLKRLQENEQRYLSSQQLFTSFRTAVINNSPLNQIPSTARSGRPATRAGTSFSCGAQSNLVGAGPGPRRDVRSRLGRRSCNQSSAVLTDRKSTPSERNLRYRWVRSMPTRFASWPTLPSHRTSCCCR
jgi:uncharacterized caspase-like protein